MSLKLGIQHWVLEYYQFCSNNDSGLTFTYFTARSNLVPYAFVWENVKTMDFSESIVVYVIKVGRKINGHTNLHEYQCQGHSVTLVQGHSDSTFSNFFSLETAKPIEAKFHMEPPYGRGTKYYSNGPGHLTKMASMPIYGKTFKKSSSLEPKCP